MGAMHPENQRDPVLDLAMGIDARSIRLEQMLTGITKTQERHGRFIDGNGHESAPTRIVMLEEQVERLLRARDDLAAADLDQSKIRWHVIGSAVALAAGILSFTMQIWGS
jgi:hypothetical protein